VLRWEAAALGTEVLGPAGVLRKAVVTELMRAVGTLSAVEVELVVVEVVLGAVELMLERVQAVLVLLNVVVVFQNAELPWVFHCSVNASASGVCRRGWGHNAGGGGVLESGRLGVLGNGSSECGGGSDESSGGEEDGGGCLNHFELVVKMEMDGWKGREKRS
jgi:hypothetical protein